MLLMLHTRMRAATLIQATWRGHVQRKLFQPVWQQYQEGKARLAAAVTLQRVRPGGRTAWAGGLFLVHSPALMFQAGCTHATHVCLCLDYDVITCSHVVPGGALHASMHQQLCLLLKHTVRVRTCTEPCTHTPYDVTLPGVAGAPGAPGPGPAGGRPGHADGLGAGPARPAGLLAGAAGGSGAAARLEGAGGAQGRVEAGHT
jgi:hypothetical protein